MSEHLYTHRKTSARSASISQHSPFQPRPFVVQTQTEEQSEQPDIKTALQRAEGYGHRLDRIKFSENPAPAQVRRIVQAKLTIGEPGDKYEQEADRVAAQVVTQIHAPTSQQSQPNQAVQRQEEEEEEIQAKPEITALQRQEEPVEEIQAKLSISDQKRSPLPTQVRREAMPEDKELQTKPILQRREAIGAGEASTDVESAINIARGGGMPLDTGLQRSMGQAMGADFSGVKVHTDAQANKLNRSIQAKAFTTGQDVFFRSGEYNPESRGGQELIAHELTHVVQQSNDVRCTEEKRDRQNNVVMSAPMTTVKTGMPEQIQRTNADDTTTHAKGEDYVNHIGKLIGDIEKDLKGFVNSNIETLVNTIMQLREKVAIDNSYLQGTDTNTGEYGNYKDDLMERIKALKALIGETDKKYWEQVFSENKQDLINLFQRLPTVTVDNRVTNAIQGNTQIHNREEKVKAKQAIDNALAQLSSALIERLKAYFQDIYQQRWSKKNK